MKVPTVHQLATAARRIEDDERVPYVFEKRIMSQLGSRNASDISAALAKMMWKAALGCLAISVVTGALVTFAGTSSGELFATDLERIVLAPVDVEDSW
jgi:hypothetical protein